MDAKRQSKVLRAMYQNFRQIEAYYQATSQHVVDHAVDGEDVSVSYFDLQRGLEDPALMSPRRREAFILNVVEDLPQAEVAERMGIAKGSVAQHVDLALQSLCAFYFADRVAA